ncbi:MAG: hypothetical protein ACR2NA_03580 [Solirubrobacterales bacterium]
MSDTTEAVDTKDHETPPKPWERQQGEPTKAAEGFRIYRDLGPRRSSGKVAETLKVSTAITYGWSRRWYWVARSQAWDDEQDRIGREATLQEVADMHRRHAQIGVVMLDKVAARLLGSSESNVEQLDASKLNARDLGYLADIAVKIERSARGEITAKVAIEHSGNVGHVVKSLQTEDARAAEAIAALVEAGVFPPETMAALGVGDVTELPPEDDEDDE